MSKTMLITGATGAVGAAVVRLCRRAGWDVVGVYRSNAARAAALVAGTAGGPGSLRMLAADLTDAAQVGELLAGLGPDYCPQVIVHAAAPTIEAKPVHRTPWDEYGRQIDGILKSAVLLTQPLLGRMLHRGGGRVIGVLSAAVLAMPPRGFSSYATAKHALAGYLRCIAAEYAGRGIVANMVSPGPMDTGLLRQLPDLLTGQMRAAIPGDQWIKPAAVARAIFWLAADAGPEITGCNLPVTSGLAF